jgi:hypothetical protein
MNKIYTKKEGNKEKTKIFSYFLVGIYNTKGSFGKAD